MYGMQGKLLAKPGERAPFVAILREAAAIVGRMEGCHLYVVSEDLSDPEAIWVFEVWDSKAAHDASLQDDSVRALIARAMPLMGGPPDGIELEVVGGHGLENRE